MDPSAVRCPPRRNFRRSYCGRVILPGGKDSPCQLRHVLGACRAVANYSHPAHGGLFSPLGRFIRRASGFTHGHERARAGIPHPIGQISSASWVARPMYESGVSSRRRCFSISGISSVLMKSCNRSWVTTLPRVSAFNFSYGSGTL